MLDTATLLTAAWIFVAFIAGLSFSSWKPRRRGAFQAKARPRAWKPTSQAATNAEQSAATAATEQLRIVMAASFVPSRLMSKSEARTFVAAEKAVAALNLGWRVMAQVSLGEVLLSPDPQAYRAINSKRVDILLISASGEPIAAIEYQGSGHYQGTAAARDAVKKEALRRAGVAYIEVTPDHCAEDMVREISRLAKSWDAIAA